MTKFEKLIEYVINDDLAKAQNLFHEIVVEKSRTIYEDIMELDSECCDDFGGDASDDFIDDIETDEIGLDEEEELDLDFDSDEGDDFDSEEIDVDFDDSDDEISKDGIESTVGDYKVASEKVVDLEDKLDELMAEFEALMSDADDSEDLDADADDFEDDSEEMDVDFGVDGGDELAADDTEEFDDTEVMSERRESTTKRDNRAEKAGRKVTKDIEWDEKHDRFDENVKLQAAPKPVTSEPAGTNKRSINANNSGAVGAVTKPVKMVGDTAHGRANPSVGNLPDAGKFKNVPAKDNSKLSAAPKPVTSQASGVNTRTPFPKD